jgi:hypothetical protein
MAQQKAGRDKANQARAQRLAAGSGQMYGNINAGLAALAPENFPGTVDLSAARKQAIFDAFDKAKPTSDIDYARVMQQQGFRPEEVAAASGRTYGDINRRYSTALRQDAAAPMLQGQRFAMNQQAGIAASGQLPRDVSMYSGQDKAGLYRGLARQGLTDPQIRAAAENRYGMQTDVDWKGLQDTVANPNLNTDRPRSAADTARAQQFTAEVMAGAQKLNAAKGQFMNMGGIAGLAQGGYPRRTGQISGPGTEKSDSIPAMLSDGEFVMTAKAVRGAGKGSRRAGAKQMYKLMHQLEKNSERG